MHWHFKKVRYFKTAIEWLLLTAIEWLLLDLYRMQCPALQRTFNGKAINPVSETPTYQLRREMRAEVFNVSCQTKSTFIRCAPINIFLWYCVFVCVFMCDHVFALMQWAVWVKYKKGFWLNLVFCRLFRWEDVVYSRVLMSCQPVSETEWEIMDIKSNCPQDFCCRKCQHCLKNGGK